MINLENLCRHFEVGNQVVRALDEVDLVINKKEYVSIESKVLIFLIIQLNIKGD